jgi:hypothetical protein
MTTADEIRKLIAETEKWPRTRLNIDRWEERIKTLHECLAIVEREAAKEKPHGDQNDPDLYAFTGAD